MKEKTTCANRHPSVGGKIKILSLVFILVCIIKVFTSCTIAPDLPSGGIWYNEQLKLVIEFEGREASVYSYDKNLYHMDLQLRNWIDGGFDIICDTAEGEIVEIYTCWRNRTSSDKFIIRLYGKANPNDDFRTQIELDDEEYVFVRIENYDEINEYVRLKS